MSDYFTAAEMETALARQADMYKNEDGVIVTANVQEDLDEVEEDVNSSLRNKYTIPITKTRSINYVKGMVLTLMREKAYERLGTGEIPDAILLRADRVRDALGHLQTGGKQMPDQDEDPSGAIAETFTTSEEPEMTRDKLKGW